MSYTLVAFVIATLLLHLAGAQQSCINTCTGSANVLTQLKSCTGCGTDDWACFCGCQQYVDALISCVEDNCSGSDVEDNIVSFCADQGVSISYSSSSVSLSTFSTSTSRSSTSSSDADSSASQTSSTGTASDAGAFLSSAVAGGSFTSTDATAIAAYLSTAVPSSARTKSSEACFVNTPYSYYSTPTWYSTLPTQAQSYYSSVNQGNTAACTLSPSEAAAAAAAASTSSNGHSGLSGGAIAGIVIGAILAALLLAALLWCCLRRRRRSRRDAAAERAANYEPRNASHHNEKGLIGGGVPTTNGRTRSQAPYDDRYGNGMGPTRPAAVASAGRGGISTPYGAGGGPMGSATPAPAGMIGGAGQAVPGANGGPNPDYSHTTTTTTRTVFRPKKQNRPSNPPNQSPPRPPPQPIQNYGPVDDGPPQIARQQPVGRRAF